MKKPKEVTALEDSKIVDMFMAREEDAIRCLSEKYGKRLNLLAYRIAGDRETADECENDAYWAAWKAIPPNEPRDYLYPFLARIVRHIALNCCRDRKRLKRQAFVEELSAELEQCIPAFYSGDAMADDIAFREIFNGFLDGLGAEKRVIFMRRYFFMEPVAEIAQHLGISVSKVKTTLLRCREQLKNCLEKEDCSL